MLLAHLEEPGMLSKLTNPIIFEDAKILLCTNNKLRDLAEDVFGPTSSFLDTKKELYDVPSPRLHAECLKTVDAIWNAPEHTGRHVAVRSLVRHCCGGTVLEEPVQGSYEWNLMEGIQKFVWRRFAVALLPRLFGVRIPGHTARAPPIGFELATNGIQLYAIANLDKTSLLDSYSNCTVAKAWFHNNSVLEDGTIMQSDGKVASDRDSFQPNLADLARHRWLLRNVHENPQLSKFELVGQSDGRVYWGGEGLDSTHLKPLDHMAGTPLSKGATTATCQNIWFIDLQLA